MLIKTPLHLLNTPFAVYLVMIYCYLPFMTLPIYTVLEKFDIRLIEASLDLGATRFMTFLRVILPLTLPGISTGFFLVFIPSFGEFVIPALMGGSRYFFVGSLISHYFLIVRDLSVGAAFTSLSSIILLVVTLFFYYFFKWLARTVR
jgi:spermidine/putrescine transport system permease protein